jgi:hypothetical protein
MPLIKVQAQAKSKTSSLPGRGGVHCNVSTLKRLQRRYGDFMRRVVVSTWLEKGSSPGSMGSDILERRKEG